MVITVQLSDNFLIPIFSQHVEQLGRRIKKAKEFSFKKKKKDENRELEERQMEESAKSIALQPFSLIN